jgi:hypothetical protein
MPTIEVRLLKRPKIKKTAIAVSVEASIRARPTPRSRQFMGIKRDDDFGVFRKGDVVILLIILVTPKKSKTN